MFKLSSLFIVLCFIVGCTPNIINYDSEKLEAEHIKNVVNTQKIDPFKAQKTLTYVHVKDEDGIFVDVFKSGVTKGTQGILLDTWKATVRNANNTSKCVIIDWHLMEFDFESSLPTEFLVLGKETINVATMHQTIWAFDGTNIALPPSGYVSRIYVREPDINKKTNVEECVLDESMIQEPKE